MVAINRKRGAGVDLGPDLPSEGAWLWAAFCDLDMTRQNGMGPGPITHLEMLAYAHIHGFEWEPPEIGAIRALDREFLIHQAERHNKPKGSL